MVSVYTPLCKKLGIDYPIIQAGMAGGITTPELVASVSEAGGLGTLGGGYLTPPELRKTVRKIKTLTKKPFAVNLFHVKMSYEDPRMAEVIKSYQSIFEALGIEKTGAEFNVKDFYEEQFQVLIEEGVPVISTTFGTPTIEQLSQAKEREIKLITMITSVEEAVLAEATGVDAVVAQGIEAGGHRGTFDRQDTSLDYGVGTIALVPQVVDHVQIPVIASGGIMDGRGLVASLFLGAQAVQLGTRFLNAVESGTDPAYRKALIESNETSTVVTRSFSGRPARGIRNEFITFNEANYIEPLAYPIQNLLTGVIRKASKEQGNPDYLALWAGQGTRLIKDGQTSEEIVRELIEQAKKLLN